MPEETATTTAPEAEVSSITLDQLSPRDWYKRTYQFIDKRSGTLLALFKAEGLAHRCILCGNLLRSLKSPELNNPKHRLEQMRTHALHHKDMLTVVEV